MMKRLDKAHFGLLAILPALCLSSGCSNSNNKINNVFYGTYVTSVEKEYPFSYSFAFMKDNTLVFDMQGDMENGISGSYSSIIDQDSFLLEIDNQEYAIHLNRDEMKFGFPIEYEGITYVAEFEKINNAPITADYDYED